MNEFVQGSGLKRLSGAIRSGHTAAYLGIIIRTTSPLTRRIDRIFQLPDSEFLSEGPLPVGCAFIVCPPRSGGTIIYQALTRAIPSVYLSNVHALLPNLGTRLLRVGRKRSQDRMSFNNYYGYTPNLFDVNEGNEFLHWLHQGPYQANGAYKQFLRKRFIRLLKMLSPRPPECVIFKNTRSYSRVKTLHSAVPEVVFVRVRREHDQIIESTVRAYHELGSFHPVPESLRKTVIEDPIQFAFAQIEAIEADLDEQFSQIPSSSQFDIHYSAFCERPYEFIETLAYDFLRLPAGSVRKCSSLSRLRTSRRKKVSDAERLKIRALIEKRERGKKHF